MRLNTETERNDGQILVTITETVGDERTTITGWEESREDLGLNKGGPDPVEGVEIESEAPVYWDDDYEQEYPRGYEKVVLAFDNEDALEAASDRLHDKATERFEWGASGADDVQSFAGAIPSPAEA